MSVAVKPIGRPGQRHGALDRREGDLGLEHRRMIPAG
jgi:hypothetical protein